MVHDTKSIRQPAAAAPSSAATKSTRSTAAGPSANPLRKAPLPPPTKLSAASVATKSSTPVHSSPQRAPGSLKPFQYVNLNDFHDDLQSNADTVNVDGTLDGGGTPQRAGGPGTRSGGGSDARPVSRCDTSPAKGKEAGGLLWAKQASTPTSTLSGVTGAASSSDSHSCSTGNHRAIFDAGVGDPDRANAAEANQPFLIGCNSSGRTRRHSVGGPNEIPITSADGPQFRMSQSKRQVTNTASSAGSRLGVSSRGRASGQMDTMYGECQRSLAENLEVLYGQGASTIPRPSLDSSKATPAQPAAGKVAAGGLPAAAASSGNPSSLPLLLDPVASITLAGTAMLRPSIDSPSILQGRRGPTDRQKAPGDSPGWAVTTLRRPSEPLDDLFDVILWTYQRGQAIGSLQLAGKTTRGFFKPGAIPSIGATAEISSGAANRNLTRTAISLQSPLIATNTPTAGHSDFSKQLPALSFDGAMLFPLRGGSIFRAESEQISTFVSQALDTLLNPETDVAASRSVSMWRRSRDSKLLRSTRSLLTAFGDTNFSRLLSFKANDSKIGFGLLSDDDDDDDDEAELEAVRHLMGGQQAMFQSITHRHMGSVSKSDALPRGSLGNVMPRPSENRQPPLRGSDFSLTSCGPTRDSGGATRSPGGIGSLGKGALGMPVAPVRSESLSLDSAAVQNVPALRGGLAAREARGNDHSFENLNGCVGDEQKSSSDSDSHLTLRSSDVPHANRTRGPSSGAGDWDDDHTLSGAPTVVERAKCGDPFSPPADAVEPAHGGTAVAPVVNGTRSLLEWTKQRLSATPCAAASPRDAKVARAVSGTPTLGSPLTTFDDPIGALVHEELIHRVILTELEGQLLQYLVVAVQQSLPHVLGASERDDSDSNFAIKAAVRRRPSGEGVKAGTSLPIPNAPPAASPRHVGSIERRDREVNPSRLATPRVSDLPVRPWSNVVDTVPAPQIFVSGGAPPKASQEGPGTASTTPNLAETAAAARERFLEKERRVKQSQEASATREAGPRRGQRRDSRAGIIEALVMDYYRQCNGDDFDDEFDASKERNSVPEAAPELEFTTSNGGYPVGPYPLPSHGATLDGLPRKPKTSSS